MLDFGALGAVEREELLRHAREAVGLAANVGDEFAHRVGVHLVLQDGVGQELDGGQRRFQLMRSAETNWRCCASDSCNRSVSLLNSVASVANSSEPRI